MIECLPCCNSTSDRGSRDTVARRRKAPQRKRRTREHVIADLAVNHVERQGLLCGYSFEQIVHDYGLDRILFTYNASGEIEDGEVFLQIKATEQGKRVEKGQAIAFRVTRSDLATW